jgi:uncharacterized protein
VRASLERGRLAAWIALVGAMTVLGYGSRAAGGKPPKDAAYQYSTGLSGLLQYAVILGVVIAITQPDWRLLALRRPTSYRSALTTALLVFAAVYVVNLIVSAYSKPGQEQGLTPDHWDSQRALPFAFNFVIFVAVAPVIEELTFRGLGYSLLAPLGQTAAVLWVGLSFGLAHGLIEGLPILIVFGAGLALLRARTDSVYPGMVVHALFNAIALILSVTT